ncbi:hypothetical protein RUM43_012382 [Polyplax serrata]|uniref:Short-chain dehydrogenase/reductase 3 n=1 Tax=Polyplax serrata TaxID=468196 RepID=A0AAN8NKL3_POLSC
MISVLLLTVEILVLNCKILLDLLVTLFRCIVPREEKSVVGEKVLITGTGHGIGKELARRYGELGAEVVCVDINAHSNQETVDELRKYGIKATGFECDVSKRENVMELYKKVKSTVGDITILVNNAGIMPTKLWSDHTASDIAKIFDVNVFAHFWLLQAFLPSMIEKDHGHVIGLSSIAGLIGAPNLTAYCSSKFAVRGLMETFAEELRKEGSKVQFTTIFPYMTDTGLCKKVKIRFPNLFNMNDTKQVAHDIISSQRRGYREATIPGFMKIIHDIGRTLPEKSKMLIVDFLDSGVLVE